MIPDELECPQCGATGDRLEFQGTLTEACDEYRCLACGHEFRVEG